MSDPLAQEFTLPCGAVLPNRLCKAAMTEGLADGWLRATARHERLYRKWSEGGAGLLLTGNVQIDRRVLERPGNVAIDVTDWERVGPNGGMAALQRWTAAGTVAGNHLWAQISHAGRQSFRYITSQPLAPSAVQLELMGNFARPRALREDEILDFIQRYAQVASICREAGFTGVQVHGAHGYLISSFLSPITNQRTDDWGGSLENRARFLLEILRATRKAVGDDFPVGLKLNSDDFRKGGFSNEDCLQVVKWLNDESVDLLEVSGGTYEQPKLLGYEGKADTAVGPQRQSTVAREAYFLDYAQKIRAVARMPMMVTGGFRSRAGMEATIAGGHCDVIGLGRPLCTDADFPKQLLSGKVDEAPRWEQKVKLSDRKWLSGASPIFLFKMINVFGQQGWYYLRLFELADNKPLKLSAGVFGSFFGYMLDEYRSAFRMHRARKALANGAVPDDQ